MPFGLGSRKPTWRRREALRRDREFDDFDFPASGAVDFQFTHRFAEFHDPSFRLTGAIVPEPLPFSDHSDETSDDGSAASP